MQPDPSMPSPRQRDVLELFRARAADRLPPPTYREIGDVLGIASTNGVADHVAALIKKGHLRRVGPEGASRRVQLTARGRRCLVDLLAADVSEALAVLRHGAGDQRPVEGTLRELGQERQVLCVTHLPQVAARANWQWQVAKSAQDGVIRSRVETLEASERVEEIARMLGGVEITEITRRHAREMLGVGE